MNAARALKLLDALKPTTAIERHAWCELEGELLRALRKKKPVRRRRA